MDSKISSWNAVLLVVNSILPTAFIILPPIVVTYLDQDSPWSILFAYAVGIGMTAMIGVIIKHNNGTPFLEWVSTVSSPVVSTLLGLILLQYYLDASSSVLREFINFLKDTVLFHTPVLLLIVISLLITAYMVRQGITTLSQVNSLVFLLYFIVLPVYWFGLKNYLDIHRLLPVFEHSYREFLLGSITPVTWFSEVAILLFLAPYLKDPKHAGRIGRRALLIITILLTINLSEMLMIFGSNYVKASSYPGFISISVVHIGNFLENLDIFFIAYWMLSIYFKLGIFLFVTLECFKQTFRVKEIEPYLVGILMVICAECLYTWKDPSKLTALNAQGRFPIMMLVNLLLPTLIYLYSLIASKMKTKRKETPS
ncbi:GerAB/ArcD/ProY family transporter [Paenibacillus sanguinis]|uniref:GerAB/ArcD/ProY family transporter n=1 Tax=Paenibacillus sanguinis TaxID=225906 RepID=UPI000594E0D9|nr:endospore germination permease [Paenibacillus sanguinis]